MESIAWELYALGYEYGDIASVAITNDTSFEDAMLHIWMKLQV